MKSTPWGATPPNGTKLAVDVVADVLHEAFKGATDVDLDMLACDVVDAIVPGLEVTLRWYDGEDAGGVGGPGSYLVETEPPAEMRSGYDEFRNYLVANMFDGDVSGGTVTMRADALASEVASIVMDWLAEVIEKRG